MITVACWVADGVSSCHTLATVAPLGVYPQQSRIVAYSIRAEIPWGCHLFGSLVVGVLEVRGEQVCGVPVEAVRFEVIAASRARVGVCICIVFFGVPKSATE